jgi:hypothetical protein
MTTKRRIRAASLLAAALLISPLAQAGGHGWYVGAAYSDVSGDYEPTPMPTEPVVVPFTGLPPSYVSNDVLKPLGSQGYKLLTGFRPRDWLAIEAGFTKFDGTSRNLELICVTTPCPGELRSDATMGTISVLGLYPLGPVDLMARAGIAHWDAGVDLLDIAGSRYGRRSRRCFPHHERGG